MKKTIALLSIALCILTFSACACEHQWIDANCENPKRCSECDATEGVPLGHNWLDADCENPQRCSKCDATQGNPVEHDWLEADCETPKTCSKCDATDGDALGHEWQNATCTTKKTCVVCQKQVGLPLEHNYEVVEVLQEATCSVKGIALRQCTLCGTESKVSLPLLAHEYQTYTTQCTVTNTCKNCGYKNERTAHQGWHFSSNYYIDSCDIDGLTFYGTVTCKGCWKTKEGYIKYSAKEFEDIFCSWVNYGNYDDLARYPEDSKNYVMKFTGYILQDCGNNMYRMSTSGRYDDVIMVKFVGTTSGRILEDDRVTVYGEPDMLYTYTSTMGAKITIPKFIAYYIRY